MHGIVALSLILGVGGQGTRDVDLKLGDPAVNFSLKAPDGKSSFTLSSNFGKRPTFLIFGSYT